MFLAHFISNDSKAHRDPAEWSTFFHRPSKSTFEDVSIYGTVLNNLASSQDLSGKEIK